MNMAKRVVFIRHGQSLANLAGVDTISELDSVLTQKGQQQADSWSQKLHEFEFDVAFCSPLRRAMETAQRAMGGCPEVPLIASRLARERYWSYYQCVGTHDHEHLMAHARQLPKPVLQLEELERRDKFWNPAAELADIERRMASGEITEDWDRNCYSPMEHEANLTDELRDFLRSRSEKSIAVFCHFGTIHLITNEQASPQNCDAVACSMDEATGELTVEDVISPPLYAHRQKKESRL
jgi:broad specificity phosphatase PhoE